MQYIKYITTGSVIAVAVLVGYSMYSDYVTNPWTRDGQVRAQVVQIAPRVSGPIIELPLVDNQQVRAGDILFRIDPRTYQAEVAQAEAQLLYNKAALAETVDEEARGRRIRKKNPGAIKKNRKRRID